MERGLKDVPEHWNPQRCFCKAKQSGDKEIQHCFAWPLFNSSKGWSERFWVPLPNAQNAVKLFMMISSIFLSSVETCSLPVILYSSHRPDSKLHEGAKSSKDGEAAFSHLSQTSVIFTFSGFFFSPPPFSVLTIKSNPWKLSPAEMTMLCWLEVFNHPFTSVGKKDIPVLFFTSGTSWGQAAMPNCNSSEQHRATPWLTEIGCKRSLEAFEVDKCQFLVAKLPANQAPSSPVETDKQSCNARENSSWALTSFHLYLPR